MVFVSSVFLLSMVITLAVGLSYFVLCEKLSLTSKEIRRGFIGVYLNAIYLHIFFFLISTQVPTLFWLAIVFLCWVSYSVRALEYVLIGKKPVTLQELFTKKTAKRIWKNIKDWAAFEAQAWKEYYQSSVNVWKIVWGTYDFSYKNDPFWKIIYEAKKSWFKHITIDFEELANPYNTTEKVLKEGARLKKNRDPKVILNSLRRLPWKLKYDEKPQQLFPTLAKHSLVFYNFFKTTAIAVCLMFVYFLYTIFFFKIQFLKQLSIWFVIGMLYFWLMSGFNFFVKRYQYGKFTSQIQRFWKRTNTSFWLIEGFLILLFFYYYLNSSQEPLYMYDYSAINQEFLVSLQTIGVNIILLSLVIYFMYFTLLRINSNSWSQLNVYLLLISVFIFFSFFIETYQFYYVISTFNERVWVLEEEDNLWSIETDNPILRTKHQYLFVCLIAKYWHFLFIFLSWVFFLIKSFERRKVTFVLFGANLQNMIILYVLNFACYIQWFKWVYRRFFDLPYTWFFTNIDNKFIFRLVFEMKLLFANLISFNNDVTVLNAVIYKSLTLWNVDSLCIWKFI